jgi:tellurite methyltransferase
MKTPDDTILDVRPEKAFLEGHSPEAASIPLEELKSRTHELPPKGAEIALFDVDPARVAMARQFLAPRGYAVRAASPRTSDLSQSGPSRVRLWQASRFLIEALERIGPPPPEGRLALDLACGAGREAVHLALAGWDVNAIDILPDALERASDLARRRGTAIRVQRLDLRRAPDLPAGKYDLATVFRFLHRPLLPAIARCLAPGGFIVYESFHAGDAGRANRSGSPRPGQPGSARPARAAGAGAGLRDGELPAAFEGFETLIARDAVPRGGRLYSQFLARKR